MISYRKKKHKKYMDFEAINMFAVEQNLNRWTLRMKPQSISTKDFALCNDINKLP